MPQSLAKIMIHLVFSTKHRAPVLAEPTREELFHYLGGVLRGMGASPIKTGGVEDHVHLLFGLSRTTTMSTAVEKVKTSSSKWLKSKAPGYANFHWQNGYGAFSVSEADIERIGRYIANQKEHHRKRTFQEEYLELLKESGIGYDDRYVWD